MADIGRLRGNLYKVALWEGATVQVDEASHTYMVNN